MREYRLILNSERAFFRDQYSTDRIEKQIFKTEKEAINFAQLACSLNSYDYWIAHIERKPPTLSAVEAIELLHKYKIHITYTAGRRRISSNLIADPGLIYDGYAETPLLESLASAKQYWKL